MSALPILEPVPPPAPKRRRALVADLLCGAGGSSTGARRALEALGWDMDLVAVNHWPLAIETHSRNHPTARHYVQDIATVRPRELVPEGYLDLLMASPTCTHHSRARGGRPTSDQQRSDPWHIITWLTELRVKRLLIENVPEFVDWGPVNRVTGKPVKSRKGEYFRAWLAALQALGFKLEWRNLVAADYGDATTRERFFLLGRSDGRKPQWPVPSHSRNGVSDLFGGGAKPWRPAREIIDWDIRGRSIFTRKKPLSPKTLARIHAGAVKFAWPEPFLVVLRQHMSAQGIDLPLPTITAGGTHIALAQPMVLRTAMHKSNALCVRGDDQPLPAITTDGGLGIAQPILLPQTADRTPSRTVDDPIPTVTTVSRIGLLEPVLLTVGNGAGMGEHDPYSRRARSVDEPLQTITAGGKRFAIAEPYILNRHGDNGATRAHSVDDPVPTADCRGAGYVVEPFVYANRTNNAAKSVEEPLGTATTTTGGGFFVAEPYILSQASGGAPRSVDEPAQTIPGGGAHALIAPYYGSGSGETCKPVDDPLDTITTKPRFGMVVPITHAGGGNRARDVADPLATVTTANRGELAFVAAAFGEREGQAPRVHSIDDPAPTICAEGRVQLVEGIADPPVYDILFRMLEPHELAAAMGFEGYEFSGNKTEITRQIGNAVPVNTAAALVRALMGPA